MAWVTALVTGRKTVGLGVVQAPPRRTVRRTTPIGTMGTGHTTYRHVQIEMGPCAGPAPSMVLDCPAGHGWLTYTRAPRGSLRLSCASAVPRARADRALYRPTGGDGLVTGASTSRRTHAVGPGRLLLENTGSGHLRTLSVRFDQDVCGVQVVSSHGSGPGGNDCLMVMAYPFDFQMGRHKPAEYVPLPRLVREPSTYHHLATQHRRPGPRAAGCGLDRRWKRLGVTAQPVRDGQ